MLYRRKILLALIEILGDISLTRTDFQKHLFLFTRTQSSPSFDFIPYKYGCYSLIAEADRQSLIKQGRLDDKTFKSIPSPNSYTSSLKEADKRALWSYRSKYRHLQGEELVRYVYQRFPYYAINSEIAAQILSKEELERVQKAKPTAEKAGLFTIGYEGKTLEAYLNQLIKESVNVLCDVRKNPLSRKYGFSKNTLRRASEQVNIEYLHLPNLGIPSTQRQSLITQDDYEQLFDSYEKNILPHCDNELNIILNLLECGKRAALTCFELNSHQCHRSRVAKALTTSPKWHYRLSNL